MTLLHIDNNHQTKRLRYSKRTYLSFPLNFKSVFARRFSLFLSRALSPSVSMSFWIAGEASACFEAVIDADNPGVGDSSFFT